MGEAASSTGSGAQLSYWAWQRRLEEAFVVPRERPEPFVMFLDDDEARRLWPNDPDPVGDLAAAVSARLDWSSTTSTFGRVMAEARRWRQKAGGQAPPTLPLLAVTVVAASRMHRDPNASSSAYFFRLAQLLRPGACDARIEEAKRHLSQGFGPVVVMWRTLHDWVTLHQDSLGVSTIRDHPHLTRIGYALSQALVRRSDRMRLTSFFAAMDFGNRGMPPPEVLLSWLRVWLSRPRGLSDPFCEAVRDPRNSEVLAGYLHRLASGWDGAVLTDEGRRHLEFRVIIDLDPPDARWAIPVVPGVDDAVLLTGDGETIKIAKPEYGKFYDTDGHLPPVATGLASGLKAMGPACVASADRRPILAFREDAGAGGWLSMPSIQPFDDHLIVAEPSMRAELEQALEAAADPGWKLLGRLSERLLPGRLLYWGVRFCDNQAFESIAGRLSPGLVQGLRPDPGTRPRLAAGLPVAARVGRAHYLAGGEPDLVLPVGTEPRPVEASLDGFVQAPPLRATGFPVELRRLGPLPEGRHELVVDGDELEFFVVDTLQATERPERSFLAWRESGGYASVSDGEEAAADIVGACVPTTQTLPDPVLLRRGGEAWVIDRYGNARRLAEPAASASQAAHNLPTPYYRAVKPQADDAWLVELREGRPPAPHRLQWQEPHFTALDDDSIALWRRLEQTAGADRLWDIYLKTWRAYAR